MKKEKLYFLLFLKALIVGFTLVPNNTDQYSLFIFSDQKLTSQWYLYLAFSHLVLVMLTYMLWHETMVFEKSLRIFHLIMWFEFIQYLLFYDSMFLVFGYELSSSILTTSVFAYYVYKER